MATLAELRAKLAEYETAEKKILQAGQAQDQGGHSKTNADLVAIQNEIRRLEGRIAHLERGGRLPFTNAIFGGRR